MPQLDAFGWAEPRVVGLGRFCLRTQPSRAVHSPVAGRPGAICGGARRRGSLEQAIGPAGTKVAAGAWPRRPPGDPVIPLP